jgi:hypothetical protein
MKVKESTTRMSGLLEENPAQLHQLWDNEAAQVAAMQEHRDRLDNMDAVLSRIYENVTKTVNLSQEMDAKVSASRQAVLDNQQHPVQHPPLPGLVCPARPAANDGTHPPHNESVPDSSMTTPNDVATVGDSAPPQEPLAPHRFANVNLDPAGFVNQQSSSYPMGNWLSSTDRPPPVGPCQVHFDNPAAYRFDNSRPPAVDTSDNHMDLANMGGHIEFPHPSNKERQARNRWTSLFDVAGLASRAYHGNQYGVQTLDIPFIHSCRYQTISPVAADDVLLCYRNIQQVHRKVRQGWSNPCTHITGPSVKRILEKGLLVFPQLKTLTANDTV